MDSPVGTEFRCRHHLESRRAVLVCGGRPRAIRLRVYPQSSNPYDSLGEAYMDDGNKPQAIANYQKSLQLNPKNLNAVKMLQKLGAS
jgi:tetratricopeptide (TPR) repeat protein